MNSGGNFVRFRSLASTLVAMVDIADSSDDGVTGSGFTHGETEAEQMRSSALRSLRLDNDGHGPLASRNYVFPVPRCYGTPC